jgi:hypothetical protein
MNRVVWRRRAPKNLETAELNWNVVCEYCSFPVGDFRDWQAKKEYNLSGRCQKCQDDFHKESGEPLMSSVGLPLRKPRQGRGAMCLWKSRWKGGR